MARVFWNDSSVLHRCPVVVGATHVSPLRTIVMSGWLGFLFRHRDIFEESIPVPEWIQLEARIVL